MRYVPGMSVSRVPAWTDLTAVVTAGPTREHLDDVRFLSNASTGRMGIEIARELSRRGAAVTLVLGPTSLAVPSGIDVVRVVSTQDLLRATREAAADADIVVFAAAPSDYKPARRRRGKPAREGGALEVMLAPTQDVAASLGRRKGARVHLGFALEVRGGDRRAREKIRRKNLDAIVLNGPQNFGTGGGDAAWIEPGTAADPLPTSSKRQLARAIVTRLRRLLRKTSAAR